MNERGHEVRGVVVLPQGFGISVQGLGPGGWGWGLGFGGSEFEVEGLELRVYGQWCRV